MAIILFQFANAVFAAATLWIHFRAAWLWDGQAIVYSTAAGCLAASVTALLMGIGLVLNEKPKWGSALLNLFLVLGFAALQGYGLFLSGRDLGILRILKSRLGGG